MATPYLALGGNDGYIATASEGLQIGYSRNADSFMLLRYCGNKPVTRSHGFFQVFNPAVGARIGGDPATDALWSPMMDRPNGLKNQIEFLYKEYLTQRYDEPVNSDRRAMEQLDWAADDMNARNLGQLCMTRRTYLAQLALRNNLVGTSTAPVDSSQSGNLYQQIFGAGSTGNLLSATTDKPAILGILNYGAEQINLGTFGVLKPRDLSIVMNPSTAIRLSMVPEIQEAFIQSPYADSLIVGNNDSAIAAWNAQWGLPVALRGYRFVIEDTVADFGNPLGLSKGAYVMPDNTLYMLATPDGPDARYLRADVVTETETRYFPVRHTLCEFMYQDMVAESFDDPRQRRSDSHVSYDVQYQVTSPVSGFAFTHLFS